jgi:hypothetical protein
MPKVNGIYELKKLLDAICKIEKVEPLVYASDAEVNIVKVTVICPDGKVDAIKAYKVEASALRVFIRIHKQIPIIIKGLVCFIKGKYCNYNKVIKSVESKETLNFHNLTN